MEQEDNYLIFAIVFIQGDNNYYLAVGFLAAVCSSYFLFFSKLITLLFLQCSLN